MIDLRPASDRVTRVVHHVADDQLALPTPCGSATVGDVLDHLGMFAANFPRVARKELDEVTSTPPAAFDAGNLEPGWRDRLAANLGLMTDAWSSPEAWRGDTWVGGMHMPAAVVGVVALDELLIHGWDLAVATDQAYVPPAEEVQVAYEFVASFDAPRDGQLFGPVVEVAPEADLFDRLVGLTGRDPGWRPTR
jgi:uncharacterized protein (TIGR03086 family)